MPQIRAWGIGMNTLLNIFPPHKPAVEFKNAEKSKLLFTQDGNVLEFCSDDGKLDSYLTKHQQCIQRKEGLLKRWSCMQILPNGRVIAAIYKDSAVQIWDFEHGELIRTLEGTTGQENLAFSANAKLLAACSKSRGLQIWDVETGTLQKTLQVHLEGVSSVSFSTNNKYLGVMGYYRDPLTVWNIETAEHLNFVTCGSSKFAISPNEKWIAFQSLSRNIDICDLKTGKLVKTFNFNYGSKGLTIEFSPDSKMLACGCDWQRFEYHLLDIESGQRKIMRREYGGSIEDCFAFSPDSKILAYYPGYGHPVLAANLWKWPQEMLQKYAFQLCKSRHLSGDTILTIFKAIVKQKGRFIETSERNLQEFIEICKKFS